jgi:hypothetical protein
VSNIAAFPPRTPKDRARAADLQNARDRMLVVAAELDRLVTVRRKKACGLPPNNGEEPVPDAGPAEEDKGASTSA